MKIIDKSFTLFFTLISLCLVLLFVGSKAISQAETRIQTTIKIAVLSQNKNLAARMQEKLAAYKNIKLMERQDMKYLLREIQLGQQGVLKKEIRQRIDNVEFLLILRKSGGNTTAKAVRVRDGKIIKIHIGYHKRVIQRMAYYFDTLAAKRILASMKNYHIDVEVQADKQVYQKGDMIYLSIRSNTDGYLYLIDIFPDDQIVILMPTDRSGQIEIKAGIPVRIPEDVPIRLRVTPPFGADTLRVFVTKEPINILSLAGLKEYGEYRGFFRGRGSSSARGVQSQIKRLKDDQWGSAVLRIRTKDAD